MDLGLLSYVEQPIRFEHLEGDVLVWFIPGHLVVRGDASRRDIRDVDACAASFRSGARRTRWNSGCC